VSCTPGCAMTRPHRYESTERQVRQGTTRGRETAFVGRQGLVGAGRPASGAAMLGGLSIYETRA
jgi:hypothetical protein